MGSLNMILAAHRDTIEQKPDVTKMVLNLHKQASTYAMSHPQEMVAMTVAKLGMKKDIAGKTYDALVPNFSTDGKINMAGLTGYADALPELGIADSVPEQSAYYSDALQK